MKEQTSTGNDKWKRLDVIIKGIGAVLVSSAIAFYSVYSENQRTKAELELLENKEKSQLFLQTTGRRETAIADMELKSLDILLNRFFEEENIKTKIALIKLLAINFPYNLNLKPLFTYLDSELTNDPLSKELVVAAAKEITQEQIRLLSGRGGAVCEKILGKDKVPLKCQFVSAPIMLQLLQMMEDRIRVKMIPGYEEGFMVDFYDVPFSNYFVRGELKYSVLLSHIDTVSGEARVKIVFFPNQFPDVKDRFRIDAILRDYITQKY